MKKAWRAAAAAVAAIITFALAGLAFAAVEAPAEATISGAIVNLDEGVDLDGQWVPMGRQLAAEMVLQEGSFEWEMSTEALAQSGLENGTYAVVVTIPSNFSAAVTSLAAGGDIVQAQVDVEARAGASKDQARATELVTRAATTALGGQLGEQFVVALLGGLGEMGSQLGDAASGANQLADGTSALANGTSELAGGAQQLASGTGQAASGFSELVGGVGQLSSGANQAASGVNQLADGTGLLVDGIGQSAAGASQLSAGVNDLASGAGALAVGSRDFSDGMAQYSAGVDEYAAGVSQYADGMNELAAQLDGSVATVTGGIIQFGDELGATFSDYLEANDVTELIQQIAGASRALAQTCIAQPGLSVCSQFTQEQLQQMADPNLEAILLDQVQDLPQTIATASQSLVDGLLTELDPVLGAVSQLNEGANGLRSGANELAAGGRELASGADGLATGTEALAGGAAELASGSNQLADGLNKASAESGALVDGAYEAADGLSQLAGGLADLEGGASQAETGLGELASGMNEFSAAVSALDQGAGELSSGTAQLADGLQLAVDSIPTYSESEAKQMAGALTQPIATPSVSVGLSATVGAAMALTLWLFSFLMSWVYPVFSPRINRSVQPGWALAASVWWKPAAWSAGMGALSGIAFGVWVGLAFTGVLALAGLGVFTGVVFAGVQQGLASAFGALGRVISLAMFGVSAIVAAVGTWGTSLDALDGLLPVGMAANLFNSVLIPGISASAFAVIGLIVWTVLAYVLAIWATLTKRSKPAGKVALTA